MYTHPPPERGEKDRNEGGHQALSTLRYHQVLTITCVLWSSLCCFLPFYLQCEPSNCLHAKVSVGFGCEEKEEQMLLCSCGCTRLWSTGRSPGPSNQPTSPLRSRICLFGYIKVAACSFSSLKKSETKASFFICGLHSLSRILVGCFILLPL